MPAVIVSPLIKPGVDHTVYDHTSVLATIENLFGLDPLTARDKTANNFIHLLADAPVSGGPPSTIVSGRSRMPTTDADSAARVKNLAAPLPDGGNIHGFLHIARKTNRELNNSGAGVAPGVTTPAETVSTYGEADAYIGAVMARVMAHRSEHEAALRARTAKPGAKARRNWEE